MPTTDVDVPLDPPHRPDHEHRVLVLADMIMNAQAAGSALLEADWPEARFRVGLIREVAQGEGLSDIHEHAQAMDLAISQAEVGRPAGVGSAFDRLSRTIDHHLEQGWPDLRC
jgi:D-alanyl-D-alanine dipeptidase